MTRSSLRVAFLLVALCALAVLARNSVAAASAPSVSLSVQNSAPRQVEETTERSVARDYANAWQVMADALDQNRTDMLASAFVGTASEKLMTGIEQQRKTGIHQRIIDK